MDSVTVPIAALLEEFLFVWQRVWDVGAVVFGVITGTLTFFVVKFVQNKLSRKE